MTVSQVELARLGGVPLHTLDQLIASRCAPIYARPPSRRAPCYTLHEAVMLATGVLLHERSGLGWPVIHHAIALDPDLFMDPLDEADGATGFEERWLAVYDGPRSASVGRLADLPVRREAKRASKRVSRPIGGPDQVRLGTPVSGTYPSGSHFSFARAREMLEHERV